MEKWNVLLQLNSPSSYFFWLMLISVAVFILERFLPWRTNQKAFRKQFGQDLFWLVFNGHYAGLLLASLVVALLQLLPMESLQSGLDRLAGIKLFEGWPLWAQFAILLVFKDFLEWCVHNLLHRVPILWQFHKVHHSIEELDWIGAFRFHWMEIVVYRSLTYLPLLLLSIDGSVVLAVAVFATLVGHLNHANLKWSYGPLKYVFNSPRMHVWHHDEVNHYTCGQNFAIVLSVWDWLFGTAYLPSQPDQPKRLGFENFDRFPRVLWKRLLYPFVK